MMLKNLLIDNHFSVTHSTGNIDVTLVSLLLTAYNSYFFLSFQLMPLFWERKLNQKNSLVNEFNFLEFHQKQMTCTMSFEIKGLMVWRFEKLRRNHSWFTVWYKYTLLFLEADNFCCCFNLLRFQPSKLLKVAYFFSRKQMSHFIHCTKSLFH